MPNTAADLLALAERAGRARIEIEVSTRDCVPFHQAAEWLVTLYEAESVLRARAHEMADDR